jgi:hypothetical protein
MPAEDVFRGFEQRERACADMVTLRRELNAAGTQKTPRGAARSRQPLLCWRWERQALSMELLAKRCRYMKDVDTKGVALVLLQMWPGAFRLLRLIPPLPCRDTICTGSLSFAFAKDLPPYEILPRVLFKPVNVPDILIIIRAISVQSSIFMTLGGIGNWAIAAYRGLTGPNERARDSHRLGAR